MMLKLKKRLRALICITLTALCLCGTALLCAGRTAYAAAPENTQDKFSQKNADVPPDTAPTDPVTAALRGVTGRMLAYYGAEDIPAAIAGGMAQDAASGGADGSGLFVLALCQSRALSGEEYDFSSYAAALTEYLNNTDITSINAATAEQYAVTLAAAGCRNGYAEAVLGSADGRGGVMGLIFGLHVLTCGAVSPSDACAAQTDKLADDLLALRLADGGWALWGDVSDVDVTAMAVAALTPLQTGADERPDKRPTVAAAVDEAVALLSERQLDSGGFASFGEENAESAAQTVIALTGLGIDPATDPRFIKNGRSALDALLGFELPEGGFAHNEAQLCAGELSVSATAQSACALTAVLRQRQGLSPLRVLAPQPDNTPPGARYIPYNAEKETENEQKTEPWRLWVCLAAVLAAAGACGVLYIKKKNPKNMIAVGLCAVVVIALALTVRVSSAEDYYGKTAGDGTGGAVTVSIECSAAAETMEPLPEWMPEDGEMLAPTEVPISAGETALEALTDAARLKKLQLEANGGYVAGIGYLYEQECGELSGWMYRVNGEKPAQGSGDFILHDGDRMEWYYTLSAE